MAREVGFEPPTVTWGAHAPRYYDWRETYPFLRVVLENREAIEAELAATSRWAFRWGGPPYAVTYDGAYHAPLSRACAGGTTGRSTSYTTRRAAITGACSPFATRSPQTASDCATPAATALGHSQEIRDCFLPVLMRLCALWHAYISAIFFVCVSFCLFFCERAGMDACACVWGRGMRLHGHCVTTLPVPAQIRARQRGCRRAWRRARSRRGCCVHCRASERRSSAASDQARSSLHTRSVHLAGSRAFRARTVWVAQITARAQGWADLANYVLRCHLPLIVPGEGLCGMEVVRHGGVPIRVGPDTSVVVRQ